MVKLTKAQRQALFRVFQRDFPGWITPYKRLPTPGAERERWKTVRVSTKQWRRFRKTVTPYFDKSGCVMVPWRGMYLGIETDGYIHS